MNAHDFIPLPARRHRKRRANQPAATPGALTLVSASYDQATVSLTLVFDRPVEIGSFDGSQILLQDQPAENTYIGASATLLAPATVEIALVQHDTCEGSSILLTASADNGIVAAGDGTPWAGVTDLVLPFP